MFYLSECLEPNAANGIIIKEINNDANYELIAEINEAHAFEAIAGSKINNYNNSTAPEAMKISKTFAVLRKTNPETKKETVFVASQLASGQALDEALEQKISDDYNGYLSYFKNTIIKLGRSRGLLDIIITKYFTKKDLINIEDIKSIIHGDLHAANIFVDDKTKSFTMIDNSGMVFSAYDPKPIEQIIIRDLKNFCERTAVTIRAKLWQILKNSKSFEEIEKDIDQTCKNAILEGYASAFNIPPSLDKLKAIYDNNKNLSYDFAD
jgi:hypothetical protein